VRAHVTIELYVEAPQRVVARRLLDLAEDSSWWPGARARGEYGWLEVAVGVGALRRRVTFGAVIGPVREWEGFTWHLKRGELRGAGEWWLEAFGRGTIVHYFLDAEAAPEGRGTLAARARRHRAAVRDGLYALKDALEGRPSNAERGTSIASRLRAG